MASWEEFKVLEWEMLSEPLSFACAFPLKNIDVQPKTIKVCRDDDYRITVKAYGRMTSGQHRIQRNLKFGETIIGEDYVFDLVYKKITLHKTHENGYSIKNHDEFELDLFTGKVSSEYLVESEVKTVTEYFLGCAEITWSGTTERKIEEKGIINRNFGSSSLNHSITSESSSLNRDCVFLENKFGRVVLCQIKRDKNSCYLEFEDRIKGQDKNHRESWARALSFFLGRRLISVGFKCFTEEGYPKHEEAYWPYSPNFSRELNTSPFPPVHHSDSRGFNDDKKLSDLVEVFMEKELELNLEEALDNFWAARTMPVGLGLMAFSASLEVLINAWFKLEKSKSHGLVLDKLEFDSKTTTWFEGLEKEVPDTEGWKRIIKKMKNSNFIMGSDKYNKFFQEVALPLGSVEKNILDARHKMAHGGSFEGDEFRRYMLMNRAYQTLICRIVLKLIGYTGKYIDYSTFGFPERDIDTPLGGPQGDGNI